MGNYGGRGPREEQLKVCQVPALEIPFVESSADTSRAQERKQPIDWNNLTCVQDQLLAMRGETCRNTGRSTGLTLCSRSEAYLISRS